MKKISLVIASLAAVFAVSCNMETVTPQTPDTSAPAGMKMITITASVDDVDTKTPFGADYLDVSFSDGNGANAVWWGWTTTGTNVYWKEHKGTVDANGNLTGMQFSHNGSYKSITCVSETVDGEIYWYLAYPREYVDTFNVVGKTYVSCLLWNAYSNYWAIPARGSAMHEVALP